MSLLSIAQEIAVNIGIPVPSTALGTDPDTRRIVQYTQEAANEVARRADWAALRSTTTILGTGSNDDFELPSGFARLTTGATVTVDSVPVRGGLSQSEWFALSPTSGTPRYFRLSGSMISFYPYPTSGTSVSISYLSENWCSAGGKAWADDTNTALIPEQLIVKGAVWRWRRMLGKDFQDYLSEFEAALQDLAKSDGGMRLP